VTKSENSKVSLLIRVYNSERYLVPCLESALNQTYENLEIIAVDDGSTDSSPEILDRYSDRIRIVSTGHAGRAAAYNAAIARMTGEWLATLDSDDMMYPDAVEQVLMHGYRYHKIPKIIYGCRTHDGQDKTKVLDHEKTKYMVHRKMIAGLGDADRKKYVEAVRRITPRMSVMTVCRDTVRLLGMLVHGSHDRTSDASEAGKSLVIIVGSLVYGPHDGAAARLASWTLRMLIANPLVQRLMNPIRFRVMASRGRVKQYV